MATADLFDAASTARANAYCPYSGYAVGACVRGRDGRLYAGCNVENLSFGLTICAERSAIAQMVAAGCRRLSEVAVLTKDGGTPCGMCLQTLLEFSEDPKEVLVHCLPEAGVTTTYRLVDLIPHGFASKSVGRTDGEG